MGYLKCISDNIGYTCYLHVWLWFSCFFERFSLTFCTYSIFLSSCWGRFRRWWCCKWAFGSWSGNFLCWRGWRKQIQSSFWWSEVSTVLEKQFFFSISTFIYSCLHGWLLVVSLWMLWFPPPYVCVNERVVMIQMLVNEFETYDQLVRSTSFM